MLGRIIYMLLPLVATGALLGSSGAGAENVPNAPTNFRLDVIGPATWTDNSNDEDGFRVYIRAGDASPRVADEVDANSTSARPVYTFEEHCKSPELWVVAFNTHGESLPSSSTRLAPPPGGCPATLQTVYTNDSGRPANALSIDNVVGLQRARLVENAEGCGPPALTEDGFDVILSWGNAACVDPGESVVVEFDVLSPYGIGLPTWLHPAAVATPAPTPSSPVNPTRTPAPTPASLPDAGGPPSKDSLGAVHPGLALAAAFLLLLGFRRYAQRE